jgi:hypothetical protein
MRTLPNDVVRPVSLLLEDLGTPVALSVAVMLRNGLWDEISAVRLDPRSYIDSETFLKDAASVAILQKLKELPTSHDRRAKAIEKWWEGERQCFRSNERLTRYLPENRLSGDQEPGVASLFDAARKIILSWIGTSPPGSHFCALPSERGGRRQPVGRFGPGSTYSDRGRYITVPDKMSSDPTLTRGAIWYLPQWYGTQWGASFAQRSGKLSFVPGNRFATVPKNAKTDRSIAAEPAINVFYQLMLGKELRSKLRMNAGWDLDRAQDIHRQVACESSLSREFATLDLSNASDTVARNLVRLLLPHGWFDALNDLRSPKTLIDKKWVVLEKFSSMGNGFTFELETLIFAALACATVQKTGGAGVLGKDVYVFGDDIIVPTRSVRYLRPVLEFSGFTLNEEKSFFGDEPFRESCGGDYFAGKPVRPFYLKDLPCGPQDYIAFANGLNALSERLALAGFSLRRRAWFAVLDSLPSRVRVCRGPTVLGDICIHDREESWQTRWRSSIRHIRVFRPWKHKVVSFNLFEPQVVLACATYGTGSYRNGVIPRDAVQSYKVGWVPAS